MSEAQPWKPHPYQVRAVKLMLAQGAAGLFLDPGLGKTSIALAALRVLFAEGAQKSALVVAPLRVCYEVWPQEIEKWSTFHGLRVAILHGPKKEQALREKADVFVINPEGLEWLSRCRWEWPEILIVDESTKFKSARSRRSRALHGMCSKFARRYILTGTPIPNGLLDIWAQIFLLDGGSSLGRWFTQFRNAFFEPTGFGGYKWQLAEGKEQEIYTRIKPLVLRLSAEEHLALPEKIETTLSVTLPESAWLDYREMEEDLITSLKKNTITAANAAVATGKLRQLASGAVYLNDTVTGEFEETHTAKIDALQDLVEELSGQPLLVAYEFRHDLERLRKRFGLKIPAIEGGVTPKRLKEIVSDWNAGKLPLLFAQPASASLGLNLQGACAHLAWFNLPWNLEHYDQMVRRIWRQGQTQNRVIVYYLSARGTIDETIRGVLAYKGATQASLFLALADKYAKTKRK